MTIIYRETDPVSGRWTGIGTDLSAFQIDFNFYQLATAVAAVQSSIGFTVSIGYITISGNQLTFHMTDHTLQGPFPIPTIAFNPVTWMPSEALAVNDVFDENGTLYLVIFAHTTALTFSPGANDGLGHNFYTPLLVAPNSALPTGGAAGQALVKSSGADFVTTWADRIPSGGNTGQILSKNSNTNQDAGWENFPGIRLPPSPGGEAGQAIATVDGTDESLEWISVVYAPSSSGSVGQVPATTTGGGDVTEWVDVVYAPPPSPAGTAGQVLSTVDGSNANTVWIDTGGGGALHDLTDVLVTEGPGIDGFGLYFNNGDSAWEAKALATSASAAIQKGDGSGGFADAVAGTDYLAPPSGTAILKANSSGALADAVAGVDYGFAGLPQNSKSANYTTVLGDAGKHILHPAADTTARTFTIDSNANVPQPNGTTHTFVNQHGGGVITIAITADTMRLAGAGTTGSRTLAADGMATALKIASTEWIISGTGLT